MQKKNSQNSRINKDYYPLEEVAERFGISKLDLIHFGATQDLPICVLARGWQVELHSRRLNFPGEPILSTLNPVLAAEREIAFQDDSKLFGYVVQPNKIQYSARHPGLKVLNGPVRVNVRSLQIYEIEGSNADEMVGLVAEGQLLPGYEYEYQFSKTLFSGKARLNEVQLVFRNADVPALELLLNANAENIVTKEASASKRLATLQMQLAALAWFISTRDPSLRDKDEPNALQIASAVRFLLEQEEAKSSLEIHGLSIVNIRTNIRDGLKLLRGNMP